jgi:hypothetical protein
VGLAERDWYREESPYWEELGRSTGSVSPRTARSRTSRGVFLAALVSLAAWIVTEGLGLGPTLRLHRSVDTHTVVLPSRPDLDHVAPTGSRWCVAVDGKQLCAVTGASESGREALTRELRARGYAVRVDR